MDKKNLLLGSILIALISSTGIIYAEKGSILKTYKEYRSVQKHDNVHVMKTDDIRLKDNKSKDNKSFKKLEELQRT